MDAQPLVDLIRDYDSAAVAFSAGVDSAVVAKAAQLALGERAVAVTGVSPSLAQSELEQARQTAELIGIRHHIIETDEFTDPRYVSNAPDRCFHCKTHLYDHMARLAPQLGVATLINGVNADDLRDYRPGLEAAANHDVRSPLVELRIDKAGVRRLAATWGLPVWNKPAAPCLSSRVAYGEEVTPQRLSMIDAAERYLRDHGIVEVRVRYHRGDVARIEVRLDVLTRFLDASFREKLVSRLKAIGFKFVSLDLSGFRSGSLNELIPVESLRSISQSPEKRLSNP